MDKNYGQLSHERFLGAFALVENHTLGCSENVSICESTLGTTSCRDTSTLASLNTLIRIQIRAYRA